MIQIERGGGNQMEVDVNLIRIGSIWEGTAQILHLSFALEIKAYASAEYLQDCETLG